MTGRARIGGLSRHQHVWTVLHASTFPMTQREVFMACATLGFTMHQIDHHLRRLYECDSVRRQRVQFKGVYRYVYRTIGKMPEDGRIAPPEYRLTREKALAINAKRRADKARFPGGDNPDDEGDNWGGGVVSRKNGVPPPIPSLGELLAR